MASLNKVILMGNLTADPELKTTPNGINVVSFSIAVGRRFAKDTDEVKADFINIVAWRNTAEFISRYFSKGKSIVVAGSLQTRNYTAQDGTKRYVTEVVADEVTFGASAKGDNAESGATPAFTVKKPEAEILPEAAVFGAVADDEDLPF